MIIPEIRINDVVIAEVEEHRHLGIILQRNGKWTSQIKDITSRAHKRVDILRSYMRILDRRSLEKLYMTYVRPILEYCNIIWDNCTKKETDEIEAVQLAAARIVTGGKRGTRHRLLYEETQWKTLEKEETNTN